MARPSSYKEEYNEQARKLCLLGATDKELAEFFEVKESTINNWKSSKVGFLESIKKGKALADANVATRLYERAMGYSHEDVKVLSNPRYPDEPIIVPVMKHYPPDTGAAFIWLKNRQPSKWRDKKESEVSGDSLIDAFIKMADRLPA